MATKVTGSSLLLLFSQQSTVKILISPTLFRVRPYIYAAPLSGFMVLYTLYFIFYSVYTFPPAPTASTNPCLAYTPPFTPVVQRLHAHRAAGYYAVGVATTLLPLSLSLSLSIPVPIFHLGVEHTFERPARR